MQEISFVWQLLNHEGGQSLLYIKFVKIEIKLFTQIMCTATRLNLVDAYLHIY